MSQIYEDANGVTTTHALTLNKKGDAYIEGHTYRIMGGDEQAILSFQNGPVKEYGVNGITTEAILAALIHRTKILNDAFPCEENEDAIEGMENALEAFNFRTQNRVMRGVEGQNLV